MLEKGVVVDLGFVKDSLIGGLIYDIVKLGVTGWENIVKVGLKTYLLSEEEIKILANGLEKANLPKEPTAQDIEKALRSSDDTNRIIEKITNNSGNTNNGTIVGVQGNGTVSNSTIVGGNQTVNNYGVNSEKKN